MPEFVNPFSGVVPGRKITKRELTRALRLALAAEEEAVHLYESVADATDEALAKAVLQDISDEEKVHVGELQRLLNVLLADEEGWLQAGAVEVNEMAEKVKGGAAATLVPSKAAGAESAAIPTVGNLKA